MSARPRRRAVKAIAAAAGCLLVAGCASTGAEPGARAFFSAHSGAAKSAAQAADVAQAELSKLSPAPTARQLATLTRAAATAHRELVIVSEWNTLQGGEEEDLQQSEIEVTEGATHLAGAMAALRIYASAPRRAALVRYRSELAFGRSRWNEGIVQLWYLAHRSDAPTV
jgi:hypothetical protein